MHKEMSELTVSDSPHLILYKELSAADLRKLEANSNDSKTGGGARDLRLPHRAFGLIMSRLLPETRTQSRGKKSTLDAIVNYGPVTFYEGSTRQTTEFVYWPPTDARPAEGRIARVHASPALGGRMPEEGQGRVLVMFIKWTSGMVTVHYAYERDLVISGVWADEVRIPIVSCMQASDSNNQSVQGYLDLHEGKGYCHGNQ